MARHWTTARQAVSCSGLCTAWQYIPPHSEVSTLSGMKDYWQNFSDLIAVSVKYVAERLWFRSSGEEWEKEALKINATFCIVRRHEPEQNWQDLVLEDSPRVMQTNFMKMCVGVVWENIKRFSEVWSFASWDLANLGIRMFKGKWILLVLGKHFNTLLESSR